MPDVDGRFLGETTTPRRWDGSRLINLPPPQLLEKRTTDPPAEVARIYFNTVENRPKIYVEQ